MAAGGCSAIDVVSILQKGRQNVTNCEVKLTSERREDAPRCLCTLICILSLPATI
ncbi:OsmC family protein [Salmonella enterica subsp. enterica]|uniref:OsmC family protein n=1 Tax=Salmonella enterica I TaxID=59201 RepID=A0A379WJZ4_SALET|nr:OsmC family protein [Salmonella enterica subsp. enterica]